MKLLESTIFGGISLLASYTLLAVILRVFHITSDYNAHMIAGIAGTVVGVIVFLLLLKKRRKNV